MRKLHQLRRTLRKLGFIARPGRGSHEIWTDPEQPRRRVVLYGRGGDDARRYQTARVRRFHNGTMIYRPTRGR